MATKNQESKLPKGPLNTEAGAKLLGRIADSVLRDEIPLSNVPAFPYQVYGVRNREVQASARVEYAHGPWKVQLAETPRLFHTGQTQRMQVTSLVEVQRIFEGAQLKLHHSLPADIRTPNLSWLRSDAGNLRGDFTGGDTQHGESDCDGNTQSNATEEAYKESRTSDKSQIANPAGVRMNKKQKAILIAAMVAVVVILIFPPFNAVLPNGAVQNLGYGLIFDPPQLGLPADRYGPNRDVPGTVAIGLLMTQWLGVLIVGAIAFFLVKD